MAPQPVRDVHAQLDQRKWRESANCLPSQEEVTPGHPGSGALVHAGIVSGEDSDVSEVVSGNLPDWMLLWKRIATRVFEGDSATFRRVFEETREAEVRVFDQDRL